MPLRVNNNILNQKGTPAFFSDTFANRPAFGFAGRVFISIDTGQIFEDTGTAWTLIADAGVGGGTLASVTANGNTTATGIVITANGLSTNSVTDTSKTAGSVLFSGTAGLISQDNANLFWDDNTDRLGISTTAPGAKLDIHGANILVQLNGTGTNNSYLQYLNAGATKWQIGNNYNAGANSFDLYNNVLSNVALSVNAAYNVLQLNANLAIKQSTGIFNISGYSAIATDAGGFFFNVGGANNAYLSLINLTGSRTYTFPDTNGTLALTADLSSYLPLAGGTLTGNLISTGSFADFRNTSYIRFSNTGGATRWGYIQHAGTNFSFENDISGGIFTFNKTVLINSTTNAGAGTLEVEGPIYTKGAGAVLYFKSQNTPPIYAWFGTGGNINLNNNTPGIGVIGRFADVTGVYTPLSNIDKKKDFEISTIGLNAILGLKPTLYRMKTEENTEKHLGFIAQEVKEFIPQAYVESDDFIGLNYNAIIATLVKSIQELNEKLVRNNII